MQFLKKLKIKSRFKFIENRVDILSVTLIIFLVSFYLANQLNESYILILACICSVIVYILYKNKVIVYLFIILVGVVISLSFFTWKAEPLKMEGEMNYMGFDKILTINKGMWFSEKLFIDNDFYNFDSGDILSCNTNFIIDDNEDSNLINQGIYRKVKCYGSWSGKSIKNFFTDLNLNLSKNFDRFNSDSSQLLKGITLGIKPSRELNVAFQKIGLSHIIVISGFNITLVLTIILGLFKKFKPIFKIIFAVSFVIFFILVVGPTAPVIRAGIMGIVAFLSTMKWKNISYLRILLLSALIMIFFDPYTIYSVSFQLSFLATAGVMMFTESIDKVFKPIVAIIREPFSQSIAASVFTIPLTTNVFSTFSPSFLLSNILILPILSLASILAYLYLLIPITPLFVPIEYLSNIMIQLTLYLSEFNNTNLLIGSNTKNFINLFYPLVVISIFLIIIKKINKLFSRIEKKRRIEYYS